jgi:hypothetical protein
VIGNPGIGKSSLSFLYIRLLLELGVKVLFSYFYFNYLFLVLFIIDLFIYLPRIFLIKLTFWK